MFSCCIQCDIISFLNKNFVCYFLEFLGYKWQNRVNYWYCELFCSFYCTRILVFLIRDIANRNSFVHIIHEKHSCFFLETALDTLPSVANYNIWNENAKEKWNDRVCLIFFCVFVCSVLFSEYCLFSEAEMILTILLQQPICHVVFVFSLNIFWVISCKIKYS